MPARQEHSIHGGVPGAAGAEQHDLQAWARKATTDSLDGVGERLENNRLANLRSV